MGLMYAILLVQPVHPAAEASWLQPALIAVVFFAGQILTFAAIQHGDVSVATPLMGAKVMLVTLIASALLHQPIPKDWWVAATLAMAGMALLGVSRAGQHRRTLFTALLAISASACYATSDVLLQRWGPAWGGTPLIPRVFLLTALFSFALLLFARGRVISIPRSALPWLLIGSVLIAVQALGMAFTLANFGAAPAVNVVYGSRGLWSILLLALLAGPLALQEQHTPRRIFLARLAGAALLLTAISLIMFHPPRPPAL